MLRHEAPPPADRGRLRLGHRRALGATRVSGRDRRDGGVDAAGTWISRAQPTHPSLIDQGHLLDELLGVVNVPMGMWIDEQEMLVRPPEPAFPWRPRPASEELLAQLPPVTVEQLREGVLDHARNGSRPLAVCEPGLVRDLDVPLQCGRDRAIFLRLRGSLLERRLVDSGDAPLDGQLHLRDREAGVRLLEEAGRLHGQPLRRSAGFGEPVGESHREAGRVGGRQQLFRAGLPVPRALRPGRPADRELAERAASRGLRIAYEALAWGAHVRTYGHAWRIIERASHTHLGLTLDTFHSLALADDPSAIASIPGERIFFLQVADAPRLAMDTLSWSRHFRCFPGQGDFDLASFLMYVLRSGYAGPLSLEVFNDVFRASDTRQTALDAMRSLLFLEEQVRARFAADLPTSTQRHVELFDPPPQASWQGIAFLEFAVDADTSLALGGVLWGSMQLLPVQAPPAPAPVPEVAPATAPAVASVTPPPAPEPP